MSLYCCVKRRPTKIRAKSVLITGASAGIGKEEWLWPTRRGGKTCACCSAKKELSDVKKKCIELGSRKVTILQIDVRDKIKMENMLTKVDDEEPLDLVVANAGVLSDTDGITGSKRVLDINVQGSLNTVYPLLDRFCKRRYGQGLVYVVIGCICTR